MTTKEQQRPSQASQAYYVTCVAFELAAALAVYKYWVQYDIHGSWYRWATGLQRQCDAVRAMRALGGTAVYGAPVPVESWGSFTTPAAENVAFARTQCLRSSIAGDAVAFAQSVCELCAEAQEVLDRVTKGDHDDDK